jgi:hypothetical protein
LFACIFLLAHLPFAYHFACLLAYVFDVDICLLMHLLAYAFAYKFALACLHLLINLFMNLITIGLLAFALLHGGCLILVCMVYVYAWFLVDL